MYKMAELRPISGVSCNLAHLQIALSVYFFWLTHTVCKCTHIGSVQKYASECSCFVRPIQANVDLLFETMKSVLRWKLDYYLFRLFRELGLSRAHVKNDITSWSVSANLNRCSTFGFPFNGIRWKLRNSAAISDQVYLIAFFGGCWIRKWFPTLINRVECARVLRPWCADSNFVVQFPKMK